VSSKILGTLSLKSADDDIPRHSGDEILEKLSYTHIAQLVGIDDPYKRVFYEMECLRGGWSVRELKRQISTMYFERTALSTNKAKLREIVKKKAESYEPRMVVRDPMVFEFLGVRPSEAMLEGEVEQRMLDRLQETLLEMGHGFCFEARQKRLLIGKEHFFVDLVFYHRVLKCHVLVELKNDDFRHEYIGQLNTYLTWYTRNIMAEGDQPPVGILLCTGKDETLVEYALAGMSNNLFVSRYLAQLPTKEELLRIARDE
jgi:predicted nuclease of restriction endonuclease-like (RecB) superfamily